MPIYDMWCKNCENEEDDVFRGMEETHYCVLCDYPMINKPDLGSFELKYDPKKDRVDWHGNTSQYYKEYKEARARGENVKPGPDAD